MNPDTIATVSTQPKLSILICTLEERAELLARLLGTLEPQRRPLPPDTVEILIESDSRQHSIGWKRNRLLERARGQYLAFVDDDDTVAPDYLAELLAGIARGVDAVCIQGTFTINGDPSSAAPFIDTPYGPHAVSQVGGVTQFLRGLQHLDAIRSDIARSCQFPDCSFTEDYTWGTELERHGLVRTWHLIDHPIYFYDYWDTKRANSDCHLAIVMPVLNHVYTTYKSVESLLQATTDPNFALIMVDDGSSDPEVGAYAQDLYARLDRRFHYIRNPQNLGVNASWNIGIMAAQSLNARYIAVVNNDVLFSAGWDKSLTESLNDPTVGVVSPMSTWSSGMPLDWPRGAGKDVNPAGYRGYMPLLGACFVARSETFNRVRELSESFGKTGVFPDQMRIYFGDNWLAAAVQYLGLQCGYDSDSYVHHLYCTTTRELDNGPLFDTDGAVFLELEERMGRHMEPFAPPPEGVAAIRPNPVSEEVSA